MAKKLSSVQFTLAAIKALNDGRLNKDNEPYKGIHTVFSGFNSAYREYFNQDPIVATTAMHKEGAIFMHGARGGAIIYCPEDKPTSNRTDNSGKAALAKMGLS